MDNRTYVVTMGDEGYACKNFDVSTSEETIFDIRFIKPLTVTEFEGHPKLYTEKDLAKARGEGQAEAWELAKKIVLPLSYGGYSSCEMEAIFGTCEIIKTFDYCPSYADAQAHVEAYARSFRIGDVIEYERTKEKRVIVNKNMCGYYTLAKSGDTYILGPRLDGWHKTGKNIDVSYIMDALKED